MTTLEPTDSQTPQRSDIGELTARRFERMRPFGGEPAPRFDTRKVPKVPI